jgi:pilus assembly protein CpaB
MNIARLAVLGVAVITAGVAAFLVRNMVSQDGPAVAATDNAIISTRVLVAGRNLGLGETIGAEDLQWQAWPEEGLSSVYVNEKVSPNGRTKWAGAFVRSPLVAGEPVTQAKLVIAGSEGVMSAILNPGMRAVGIEISAETGAGGFILPNDRVDVILTYKYKKMVGERRSEVFDSQTIMENIRVLAIDQTFRDEDGQQVVVGRTATMEMPNAFAEQLALADAMGDLSLSLRSLANAEGEADSQDSRLTADFSQGGRKSGDHEVTMVRYGRKSTSGGSQ